MDQLIHILLLLLNVEPGSCSGEKVFIKVYVT